MSPDTPITNGQPVFEIHSQDGILAVDVEFARRLERGLNDWRNCATVMASIIQPDYIHASQLAAPFRDALAEYHRLKSQTNGLHERPGANA